jgi:hypothetical protein
MQLKRIDEFLARDTTSSPEQKAQKKQRLIADVDAANAGNVAKAQYLASIGVIGGGPLEPLSGPGVEDQTVLEKIGGFISGAGEQFSCPLGFRAAAVVLRHRLQHHLRQLALAAVLRAFSSSLCSVPMVSPSRASVILPGFPVSKTQM